MILDEIAARVSGAMVNAGISPASTPSGAVDSLWTDP